MDINNPSNQDLRKFGLTMGAMIGVLFGGVLPWLFGFDFPLWPWPVAACFALPGLVFPASLSRVFRGWMKFAGVLGWINTRILLGVVFMLVFAPVGLVMRLFGNDPMRRKRLPAAVSYRVVRTERNVENMENPY